MDNLVFDCYIHAKIFREPILTFPLISTEAGNRSMNDPDFDPYLPPRAPIGFEKERGSKTIGLIGNPWLTMWTQPRATIRGIVETDPSKNVSMLVIISGITGAMNNAMQRNTGDQLGLPGVLIASLIGGMLGGALWIWIFGGLTTWTAHWIGGNATTQETRAALAWGAMPNVVIFAMLVMATMVFGISLYQKEMANDGSLMIQGLALIGLGLSELVLGIWSLVITCKAIGEVNRFSAWKGFGAMLLSGLVVVGIVIAIVVLVLVMIFAMKGSIGMLSALCG
jgi:hypothetical protein